MKTIKIVVGISIVVIMSMCLTACIDLESLLEDTASTDKSGSNLHYGVANEWVAFDNGVEFRYNEVWEKIEIKQSYTTYVPNGKFIVLSVSVKNNSTDTFASSATDVWLKYKEKTKIAQSQVVYHGGDGWSAVSLSATLTKKYALIFDVGTDVALTDLELVINNGSLLKTESVIIKLSTEQDTDITE